MTVGRIFTKCISCYLYLGLFFEKRKKTRVSHRVKIITGDPDVKDDPNDPLTR